MTLEFLFYQNFTTCHKGGFEQLRPGALRPAGKKQPCGLFLAARLAQSTRAHQEIAPRSVSFWVLFFCTNPLFHDGKMTDCIPSDADLQKGFDGIPHFPGNE